MKLFVDMDGVLTAFSTAVEALGDGPAKGLDEDATEVQKQVMYDAIEACGEKFWATMPWKSGGKELWAMVKPYNPVLLSSPGKFRWAKSGKLQWVRRNIPGTSLFFSDGKSEYVDPYETCILIDDIKTNTHAWEEAGGIGIIHQSFENTERIFMDLVQGQPKTATLSKELQEVTPLLDGDEVPSSVKVIVNRIIREDPDEHSYETLKEKIKTIKNHPVREALRYLVLIPIQIAMGKISPLSPDYGEAISKRREILHDLRSKTKFKEIATKGAPSKQIVHSVSAILRKLARSIYLF